ncbi:MAG: RDD family protein [Microlunatus sp.]|nr:RDD family protein [Microlunatus sp.]
MSSSGQDQWQLRPGIRARRLLAWGIDWCCILGWVAVVAAVGIPLYRAGVVSLAGLLAQNLVGLVVIIPVVAAAAWRESSPGSATPGKRALGLSVRYRSAGRRLPRALLRNVLKIGLPWAIGHLAVFAIVDAGDQLPGWVGWLTAAAYLLPVLWVVSLALPGARTIYDRLSGTDVR